MLKSIKTLLREKEISGKMLRKGKLILGWQCGSCEGKLKTRQAGFARLFEGVQKTASFRVVLQQKRPKTVFPCVAFFHLL